MRTSNMIARWCCSGGLSALASTRRAARRLGVPSPLVPWLRHELEWRRRSLRFHGRDDDLFIVSFPRSGTTLMQMLVYQLLTDGRMDFEYIGHFAPFLEREVPPGTAIELIRPPRVLKAHRMRAPSG